MSEIAEALQSLGLEVWFDAAIEPGTSFSEEISREVRTARCVLACFTNDVFPHGGDEGGWVIGEATIGRSRKALVAVVVEPTDFDPPWNTVHVEDLIGFSPSSSDDRTHWRRVLTAVGRLIGRPGLAALDDALRSRDAFELSAWARNYPADPMSAFLIDTAPREDVRETSVPESAPLLTDEGSPADQALADLAFQSSEPIVIVPEHPAQEGAKSLETGTVFEPPVTAPDNVDVNKVATSAIQSFARAIEERETAELVPKDALASSLRKSPSVRRGLIVAAGLLLIVVAITFFGVDRGRPKLGHPNGGQQGSTPLPSVAASSSSPSPPSVAPVPTPTVASFTFGAQVDPNGHWSLTGSIPSAGVYAQLLAAVRLAAGNAPTTVMDGTTVRSGAPKGFQASATLGIVSLSGFYQGNISYDGRSWQFNGIAPSSVERDRVVSSLASDSTRWKTNISVKTPVVSVQTTATGPFAWSARKNAGGQWTYEGLVPSLEVRRSLGTYADNPTDTTRVANGGPLNFATDAGAGLRMLQQLIEGSVSYDSSGWTVEGITNSPGDRDQLVRSLLATVTVPRQWSTNISLAPLELEAPAAPQVTKGVVQVATDPSEEGASQAADLFKSMYPALAAKGQIVIVPTIIGTGATEYRVNLVVPSFGEAIATCSQIKATGGECLSSTVTEGVDDGPA